MFKVGDRVVLPEDLPWFREMQGTVVGVQKDVVFVLWDLKHEAAQFLYPEKLFLVFKEPRQLTIFPSGGGNG